jgi:hypothetical protein
MPKISKSINSLFALFSVASVCSVAIFAKTECPNENTFYAKRTQFFSGEVGLQVQ